MRFGSSVCLNWCRDVKQDEIQLLLAFLSKRLRQVFEQFRSRCELALGMSEGHRWVTCERNQLYCTVMHLSQDIGLSLSGFIVT